MFYRKSDKQTTCILSQQHYVNSLPLIHPLVTRFDASQ